MSDNSLVVIEDGTTLEPLEIKLTPSGEEFLRCLYATRSHCLGDGFPSPWIGTDGAVVDGMTDRLWTIAPDANDPQTFKQLHSAVGDLTNWDSFRYLHVGFDVPEPATLLLHVDWYEVQLSVYGEAASTPHGAYFPLPFMETGSGQTVDVDLALAEDGPAGMRRVRRVCLSGFPPGTTWKLESLELRAW